MEQTDVLLTLAEVSVAFAGFSSLASLFARSRSMLDENLALDSMRMLNMLTASLSATALALLPLIFFALELSPRDIWRLSPLLGLVGWGLASFFVVRRVSKTKGYGGFRQNANVLNSLISVTASLLLFFSLWLTTAADAFAAYLTALLLILAVSGVHFFILIDSMFSDSDSD